MNIAGLTGLPPRAIIRNTDKLLVSDRNCGIEIEIENVRPSQLRDDLRGTWDITDDHSLRPRGMSAELRTLRGGLCGKALTDSLDSFARLNLKPGPLHFSWRTGLHVHVDVRDKVPEDIRVIATKYALIEPYLFHWTGAGRHESRFSMPWWVVSADVANIQEMQADRHDRPGHSGRFANAVGQFSKYTALNLAPMTRLGTIEFRHGQSTPNITKILDYVNIGLALVESSESTDDPDQCIKLVQHYIQNGPEQFMSTHIHPTIAGLLAVQLTNVRPLTTEIIQASVETAIHIAGLEGSSPVAKVALPLLDTLEAVIMNRDNAARRSRTRVVVAQI